ncbi:MAG: 50S ribosomal protein L25 [Cyanobacteria bacterium REEB67]|nr:50S ribosomal protein L25 [Cyanobacteria bacterium REEB67]
MEKFKLAVAKREAKKPNQLRREGFLPATLYGRGVESENIQINAKEFSRLPAGAHSHMIELDIEGKKVNAIIRGIQRHSTKDFVYNVELYKVALDRKLTVTVPLKLVGESPAVKLGGVLVENFQEAEIECLPGNIPEDIEVNLSLLGEVEDAIHFGQLEIAKDIKILNPHDEIIVKVVAPKAAPTPKEAAAAAPKAAAPAAKAAAK